MQHIVNSRISRHVAPVSSRAKRAAWIAVSVLGVALTAPEARADLYNLSPTASAGVNLDQNLNVYSIFPDTPAVGGGLGFLQFFNFNAYMVFDLSAVKGQITQITLSGMVDVGGIVTPPPGYASVDAQVSFLGTNPFPAGDPQTAFQIITNPTVVIGGFTADNGLTQPDGSPPIGSAFSAGIDPAAFGSPASPGGLGTIYLGFNTLGFTNADDPMHGVEGFLFDTTLQIRTVPEPASISLGLIGAAGAWGMSRKKKSRPRATVQV